jgi:hypothetical protein
MALEGTITATPKGALKTGGALGLGRWAINPDQQIRVAEAVASENGWGVLSVDTVADVEPGKAVTFKARFDENPGTNADDAVYRAGAGTSIVATGAVIVSVLGIAAASIAWNLDDLEKVTDDVEGVAKSQFATLIGGAALAWAVSKVLDAWYKRAT